MRQCGDIERAKDSVGNISMDGAESDYEMDRRKVATRKRMATIVH